MTTRVRRSTDATGRHRASKLVGVACENSRICNRGRGLTPFFAIAVPCRWNEGVASEKWCLYPSQDNPRDDNAIWRLSRYGWPRSPPGWHPQAKRGTTPMTTRVRRSTDATGRHRASKLVGVACENSRICNRGRGLTPFFAIAVPCRWNEGVAAKNSVCTLPKTCTGTISAVAAIATRLRLWSEMEPQEDDATRAGWGGVHWRADHILARAPQGHTEPSANPLTPPSPLPAWRACFRGGNWPGGCGWC